MNTPATTNLDTRQRFPAEIIRHRVWLYDRFSLRDREGEALMAERGVTRSPEALRDWCRTFGQTYAHRLRRRCPRPGDTWHLDEVFLPIHGERQYRWRAVGQDGPVLDSLVPRRRDKHAAKKFFRKLLQSLTYVPRVISTAKLASYGAATRESRPRVEHRQHRFLNTRAENSHQPTRQRERTMRRCKSAGQAQRFLSAPGPILSHCRPGRSRLRIRDYRLEMAYRRQVWPESTATEAAPKREDDGPLTWVSLGSAQKPLI